MLRFKVYVGCEKERERERDIEIYMYTSSSILHLHQRTYGFFLISCTHVLMRYDG